MVRLHRGALPLAWFLSSKIAILRGLERNQWDVSRLGIATVKITEKDISGLVTYLCLIS